MTDVALTVVLSFLCMSAIGYFWEQVEISNAIQRTMQ